MNNKKKVPDGRWKDLIDCDLSQGECCDMSGCGNSNIDCGECMFSELFCSKDIYDKWKEDYLRKNGRQD